MEIGNTKQILLNAENIFISKRVAFIWAIPAFFGAMFIGLFSIISLVKFKNILYEYYLKIIFYIKFINY